MLRALFGESNRQDEGYLLEANQAIKAYLHSLLLIHPERQSQSEKRFIIWSEGFLRAIDELEQSEYAAVQYGKRIKKIYLDEMSSEERDNYHRHLYFYKNALIRIFAVLDKLGHFLNERYELQTERVKPRYSYYTVLRNMHLSKQHTDLEEELFKLKQQYKEQLNRLRNRRNLEIHSINADLFDDMMRAVEAKYGQKLRMEAENIAVQLDDLEKGLDMTFRAVTTVFRYLIHKGPESSS